MANVRNVLYYSFTYVKFILGFSCCQNGLNPRSKQARKGFRPQSAIFMIFFFNLGFFKYFGNFSGGFFLTEFAMRAKKLSFFFVTEFVKLQRPMA